VVAEHFDRGRTQHSSLIRFQAGGGVALPAISCGLFGDLFGGRLAGAG